MSEPAGTRDDAIQARPPDAIQAQPVLDGVIQAKTTAPAVAVSDAAPTWRLVLWLAWPVLIQQLLILTVLLSDQFLAGYFPQVPARERAEALGQELAALGLLGEPQGGLGSGLAAEALWQHADAIRARQRSYQAAQTTAVYLHWFLASYMVLVSVASAALVSRFVGGGDWPLAIHATNQSILLAVVMGLAATATGLLFVEQLVRLLGLRGDAADYAVGYLRPVFWLLAFQVIETAGINCLIGAGDTRTGLWVLGGVAILNLPLAWSFYHGGLGFVGIALGTAVSHMLGGLAVLVVLARGRAGLRLVPRLLWPNAALLRRLLNVGVPAGIDSLSLAVCQLWFLRIVNELGDVASSAHGIALRWEGLGFLSGAAFGTAAMTLVGQNLGASRPDRAAQSGWLAFWLGCGVMTVMGAVFFVLAPWMFYLFCPRPEQGPIIEAGVPVLRLVAFAMPPLASCIIFTFALRGAGDTRVPVLFTWIGMLGVRIPLAYLLTRDTIYLGFLGTWSCWNLGLFGAWLAMFADLVVRGVFLLVRFAGGRWQRIKV